jgi:hypothetical protein
MSDIKTIVDHIGRTVIGEVVQQDDKTITLNNPVIVHVQPNPQNGQLQVQSFPYIFMEFLTPESRDKNHWIFNKSHIVLSEVQLDNKIIMQYNNINTPQVQAQQGEPEVIKLFTDE